MKVVNKATGYHNPHTVMLAEGGDFLPNTIIIHHNGKEVVYRYEDRKI